MKTFDEIKEETPFESRIYRKQELAMLYFPDLDKTAAQRNLRRWIKRCTELYQQLVENGYDKNRKFYLHQEVDLIVQYLGLP